MSSVALWFAPIKFFLTASTSEAYSYLFKLLANPGDEVLTPQPSYPLFQEFLATLESVHVRPYPLRYDGAWHIDFDALEREVSPRTRAIVVVNPNNPTGQYLKSAELKRLDSLCTSRDIAILSDEVFCDYSHGDDAQRVHTVAGMPGALKFSMSGLSKIAGLPPIEVGLDCRRGPRSTRRMRAIGMDRRYLPFRIHAGAACAALATSCASAAADSRSNRGKSGLAPPDSRRERAQHIKSRGRMVRRGPGSTDTHRRRVGVDAAAGSQRSGAAGILL